MEPQDWNKVPEGGYMIVVKNDAKSTSWMKIIFLCLRLIFCSFDASFVFTQKHRLHNASALDKRLGRKAGIRRLPVFG